MCAERGRFLFEIRKDLFPHGYLTQLESEIWAIYYDERSKESSE